MGVISIMIPIMIILASLMVLGFFWAMKSEQFEDLEAQKYRIFFDEKK